MKEQKSAATQERKPLIFNNPHQIPLDARCSVCGKPLSQLKPFGGPGDPVRGDFTGQLLIKTYRWDFPRNKEADKAWNLAFEEVGDDGDHYSWLISKYGKEKAEEFYQYEKGGHGVHKSWECRDCILLDEEEYFRVRDKAGEEK